ncbi:MAG: class III extradiol dioxygenase family protein [Steroidobacteraceae bacterium]
MATVIGSVSMSHIPMIGMAINRGLQQDAYFKPFFDGFAPVHRWLAQTKPDVAVIFYNDHGLNFFLDKMPTFAIGAAPEYQNADEGWGLKTFEPLPGDPELSWHIIEGVVAEEFDVTTCQELQVDHASSVPVELLWPNQKVRPVKVIPIMVNTVQHPLPSAKRCLALGQAVGRAIESYKKDLKVVVLGTGGLSHQLDGERAGFINKPFDFECLDNLIKNPAALAKYSNVELVRLAGTQGVELLNWMAARGTLLGDVNELHRTYHIPISNTASAIQLLENRPAGALRRAG